MKKQSLLLFFIFSALLVNAQFTLQIDAAQKRISKSENFPGKTDSMFNTLVINLPQSNFEKLSMKLNDITIGFYNKSKPPVKNFITLYAEDIFAGRIVLKFKTKHLVAINNRVSTYQDDFLNGKDTIKLWLNSDSLNAKPDITTTLDFVKTDIPTTKTEPTKNYISKYCKREKGDTLVIEGLENYTFLCDSSRLKSNCYCGIPVYSPFEKMYLPPCFDPKGNAVSATNYILIDTRPQTDPHFKVNLFTVTKGTAKCNDGNKKYFEYDKIEKKLSLTEGTLVPISVIAHKDSTIIIDSNYVNFFLDSAKATEDAFTAAGKQLTVMSGNATEKITTDSTKNELNTLRGAVTLRDDLMFFNNHFDRSNYILNEYLAQLICLQKNFSSFFNLSFIPKSGKELAIAIESKIKPEIAQKYGYFLCSLLGIIAQQYDVALNRNTDYRMYTKVFQIPNADEISFKAKTKGGADLSGLSFQIKGGWKIDFSSGVFVLGLNNKDFVRRSLRLSYRDSSSGPLKDTTGNFIDVNKGKLNFNTGLMVHLYKRSGDYVNKGIVTGVIFNNSEFTMLLGGSLMFRMGSARLSLVGGIALGKQKELDANQKQFQYEATERHNDIYIQNDIDRNRRLPRFFDETNINTYDKLKIGWFAGITYNFASIKLGK